jgi:hypothetical protein
LFLLISRGEIVVGGVISGNNLEGVSRLKRMSSIEYDDTQKIAKIDGLTVDEWLAEQDLRANLIPNYDPPLRTLKIFELINKEKMMPPKMASE